LVEAKNEALEGSSEAVASDPKQEARDLLQAGSTPEEVMEQTGLSKAVVLGLLGAQVKAAKKLSKSGEEPSNSLGKPDDEEKTLISDFKGESSLASSALVLARNKSRLRQTDPALYNSLFPSGQQPEVGPAAKLIDLEIIRQLREMRQAEEHRNNGGGAEASEGLNLRKEIDALRQEMHQKEIETLQKASDKLEGQITELREDMRHSTNSGSDLAVVVKEASSLLEKAISHDGPLRSYLMPDNIKPRHEAPTVQGPDGRNAVLEALRPFGYVTKLTQRPS